MLSKFLNSFCQGEVFMTRMMLQEVTGTLWHNGTVEMEGRTLPSVKVLTERWQWVALGSSFISFVLRLMPLYERFTLFSSL